MFDEPRFRPSNHFFRITTPIIECRKYLDCDLAIHKQRDVVERMFCCFKDWRTVATRYDRTIKTFMATFAIASTVIWWLS